MGSDPFLLAAAKKKGVFAGGSLAVIGRQI